MRTIVRGKNLEVPDRVREYGTRKLARLERLLDDRTDAVLELTNEAHRSAADAHIADVTLVIDGTTLKSKASGASYQAAIDQVVDKVERQARDYKEKPRVRSRPEEEKVLLRRIADGTADGSSERQIVKTKRFAIEPMYHIIRHADRDLASHTDATVGESRRRSAVQRCVQTSGETTRT